MTSSPISLTSKIVAIHHALRSAEVAHAFGGALALAFCTEEPRATRDIDLNVFLGTDELDAVIEALPPDISVTATNRVALLRDGQDRLWWDDTPVDLFLSNHTFHDHAEANRRYVPFAGIDDLAVLACADLAVFKAFFARPKDAVDVATMAACGAIDVGSVESTVHTLLGESDARRGFFARVRSDLAQM